MIPIQNIYYLLCYAWNKLDEREIVEVDAEDATQLIDLLAKVLINGTTYLFKKGLDRGYLDYEESVVGIKGKLKLETTLKKQLLPIGKTYCSYSELSYNVLHNCILKSIFRLLLKVEDLDKKHKKEVLRLFQRFHNVQEIPLNAVVFKQVRLHKNNQFYDFLIKISELIYQNLLPNEAKGSYRFKDFIRDERKMAYLFEAFVRNFYQKELKNAKVYSEIIEWNLLADSDSLPMMRTDISIEWKGRKLIIDTKFYKEALRKYFDKEKVRENNLYQMFAYLKNVEAKNEISKNCNGLLLYPAVDYSVAISAALPHHKIFFQSINLRQHWSGVRKDLLKIVGECI